MHDVQQHYQLFLKRWSMNIFCPLAVATTLVLKDQKCRPGASLPWRRTMKRNLNRQPWQRNASFSKWWLQPGSCCKSQRCLQIRRDGARDFAVALVLQEYLSGYNVKGWWQQNSFLNRVLQNSSKKTWVPERPNSRKSRAKIARFFRSSPCLQSYSKKVWVWKC